MLFADCYAARFDSSGGRQPIDFAELGAILSPSASIFLPDDSGFENATLRWSAYSAPSFRAVVEVATEKDIQETVRFANRHLIPFLATGGAHGFVPTLGRLQNGIEIDTSNMKSIQISDDGKFAQLGPGFTNGQLIRALWAKNKRTVTGNCMCTGMMGVTLGGGHGLLQGQFGLAADQLMEARLVLANGSAITVSSESHTDLYWALRGAGHNFGILSSLKFRIHPGGNPWTFNRMLFKGDKVEEVFVAANRLTNGANHPPGLINMNLFIRIPAIDPENTLIMSTFMYEGPKVELEKLTAAFRRIGPVNETTSTSVQYPDIFDLNGQMEDDPAVCATNLNRHLCPIYLNKYNPKANRKVYNIFNNVTADPRFTYTVFLWEGYSTQAVKAVPEASTAAPWRDYNLLASPVLTYANKSLSGVALAAAKEMRKVLLDGSNSNKLHAYVNYAFGDETLQELYGFEPWRVERLKKLKKKYDPEGRFNFYAPIA
ncbi:FAD-binding domain-containing protein [Zopfia rhizophila CBS 207.26]|uniref:FAD-binding domain-containing protein n=1 Tax=Zopfia rhizophila CBS 207.26 TaxID=1314779 RepID=A0A6A6EJK1_9PEZI|nr:FAD-binding domain-containing protein [Zopfia rhizophila CBS 207.26]